MTQRSPAIPPRQTLEMLNGEINRMPPPLLNKLKQDLGFGDKDVNAFTIDEKVCSLLWRFPIWKCSPPALATTGKPVPTFLPDEGAEHAWPRSQRGALWAAWSKSIATPSWPSDTADAT